MLDMDAKSRLSLKLDDIAACATLDGDVVREINRAKSMLGRVADEHACEIAKLQSVLAAVMADQPLSAWTGLALRMEKAAGRIESAVNLASKTVPIATEAAPVLERVA